VTNLTRIRVAGRSLGLMILVVLSGNVGCDVRQTPSSPTSVEANPSTAAPQPGAENQIVVVQGVVVLPLSGADFADLPSELLESARASGWARTATGLERVGALPRVSVSLGNTAFDTDDTGRLVLPGTLTTASVSAMRVEIDGVEFPLRYVEDRDGIRVMRVATPFVRIGHDHGAMRANGAVGPAASPMTDQRCLDYNGRWSNSTGPGVGNDQSPAVAVRNFIDSDCERANRWIIWCLREYLGQPGCALKHGLICSIFIGHSTEWHRH